MEKVQGYEEAQAMTGEYERLNAGGYICKIISAKEEKSKSGKRMLVLALDIVEGGNGVFNLYNEIGDHFWGLIEFVKNKLPDDKIVYLLCTKKKRLWRYKAKNNR